MQKLKDFILMFGWFLGFETLAKDIWTKPNEPLWSKYLTPIVFGLLFAFLILPYRTKQKMEKDRIQIKE